VRPVKGGVCHTKMPSGETRTSCYYRKLTDGGLTKLPAYTMGLARPGGQGPPPPPWGVSSCLLASFLIPYGSKGAMWWSPTGFTIISTP
jgi:hypothetical protein